MESRSPEMTAMAFLPCGDHARSFGPSKVWAEVGLTSERPCPNALQRSPPPSHRGAQPQPKGIELDEALGIELVVGALILLERDNVL